MRRKEKKNKRKEEEEEKWEEEKRRRKEEEEDETFWVSGLQNTGLTFDPWMPHMDSTWFHCVLWYHLVTCIYRWFVTVEDWVILKNETI